MEALRKNHIKILPANLAKKLIIIIIFMFVFDFSLFSMPALASEIEDSSNISIDNSNQININNHLPENSTGEVKSSNYYQVTAYNSEIYQTDDSPCITANGFNVCEHGLEDTVAANFLPFGVKIRMPDIYGDKIFIVRDRMNARYNNKIDIWMQEKQAAKNFGIKIIKVEIIE